MKIIATIAADLVRSPLGTRSRLADDLAGKPVLRRTLERARRVEGLDEVFVLSPADQGREVSSLLGGLEPRVETYPGGPPAYASLVRAGRAWGLDGWRGGIGGACCFDEDIHVPAVAALAEREKADAVVSIPAGAAVVATDVIEAMIRHFRDQGPNAQLTFVQAPPGLGVVILGRVLLAELIPSGQPPGLVLAYRPDQPTPDLTGKEPCYRPAAPIIEARGRLICDTRRSFDRVSDLLAAGGEHWDAERVCTWLTARETTHVDDLPAEIEIELTTEDPAAAGTLLRPRGDAVGRRGPITLDAVRAVASEIAGHDDVRIVLGGFGEPCCHPQFAEVCRILRDSSALAIAVRTHGLVGDESVEAALFKTPVDIIEFTLDAATAETHRLVYGVDRFEDVQNRLKRWLDLRLSAASVLPLIVPSFVKARETIHEMEPFFEHWMRQLGMAVITGHSHHAGRLERRAVTCLAPPARRPCARVFARTLVLADGTVVTCDQDFAGRQPVGRIGEMSLSEAWRSKRLGSIRAGAHADLPLCPACDEWHRP